MKTMIIAAAAMLSLGVGFAYADSEGGQYATTQFTQTPGFLAAPVQKAPPPRRGRRSRRGLPSRATAPGCSRPTVAVTANPARFVAKDGNASAAAPDQLRV